MPTYGCTSMLTFILNVLGEVLGIGNLYCRLFYSAGSGPCARPREFENRLLNNVLANFGCFLPPLILEQTHVGHVQSVYITCDLEVFTP